MEHKCLEYIYIYTARIFNFRIAKILKLNILMNLMTNRKP